MSIEDFCSLPEDNYLGTEYPYVDIRTVALTMGAHL
jgi:hypothetical protein